MTARRRSSAVVGKMRRREGWSDLQDAAAGGLLGMGNFSVEVGTIGFFLSSADNLAVVDAVTCLVW
jgi:hypothetical protein